MDKDRNIKIIVGLGNPGRRYLRTRHNVGFMALDRFAARCGRPNYRKKTQAYLREDYVWGNSELALIKPQLYMNLSGEALAAVNINWTRELSSLLVICDDASLDFGRIRLRGSGSSGGQKGLKNIVDVLGTQEIARLRIGIGGNPEHVPLEDYVLQPFARGEQSQLPEILDMAADAIECIIESGFETAMNRYNKKSPVENED
jgi:peptidyl-tRNA hydrolase, PTH1 family